jgi:hypothetical protein
MIHKPQSIMELIGRIEVMSKLYEAWNDLTRLYTKTLKIYKEDWGMDRDREMLIYRAKEQLPKARLLIEQVINLFKEDIKLIIF